MEERFFNNSFDSQKMENIIKTSTTTVAIKVKNGIIVGTESQATAGYFVATKQAQKLFKINNFCAATISGGVADCQYVVNQAIALSNLKTVEDEKIPEPKYIANTVRNLLFQGRSYFMSMIIIAGFSEKENKGILYGIDLLGTLYEEEKFLSFGSGSPYSLGVLETEWKENMTIEEGSTLVEKAITSSRARDAGSGFKIQLAVITKDGFIQKS
jgi:proteasome beta subunit